MTEAPANEFDLALYATVEDQKWVKDAADRIGLALAGVPEDVATAFLGRFIAETFDEISAEIRKKFPQFAGLSERVAMATVLAIGERLQKSHSVPGGSA